MRVWEKRKFYVVLMVMMILQIMNWVCSTSRPIVSFDPDIKSPQGAEQIYRRPIMKPNEEMERRRRIGSKPPSCEKKCYGCEPCEAIQVPTISSIPHLCPHYANYQPEGWRCHCAP